MKNALKRRSHHIVPQHRQVTVLSCDLVDSVALTRKLGRERYSELLAEFSKSVRTAVLAFDGHEHEVQGDCVYALFGFPSANETAAEDAIRSALSLLEQFKQNSEFADQLRVRIGIATSMLLFGTYTNLKRLDAIGDAMNLVARLKDIGPPGSIIISQETRQLIGEIFELKDLGAHEIKGYEQPLKVWQIVGRKPSGTRFKKLRNLHKVDRVGREVEWNNLCGRWADVQQGAGRAALICGEAGIGKSRLVHDLADVALSDGGNVAVFQCEPHLVHSHLSPAAAYIALRAGISDEDPSEIKIDKIKNLTSEIEHDLNQEAVFLLAELLSVQHGGSHDRREMSSIRQLQLLLDTIVEVLTHKVASQPQILVFEDLHWADDSTLELVDRLVRFAEAVPIMLVMTTREAHKERLAKNELVSVISLPALSKMDGVSLIHALSSGQKLPQDHVTAILDWSNGIPLDIEEHTRAELLRWAERFEGQRGANKLVGDPGVVNIAASRRDGVKAQLDLLNEGSQKVARAAATIGQEFSIALLEMVLEDSKEKIEKRLGELVNSTIVERIERRSTSEFRFRHARYRDAAYEAMSRKERQSFHAQMASYLVRNQPDLTSARPELLANHFERAGNTDLAIKFWVEAGNRSSRRAGYLEAVTQFERAIALLEAVGDQSLPEDGVTELELRISLGAAYEVRDGFSCSTAKLQYDRAMELCRQNQETATKELFATYSGYGSMHIVRGNFSTVLEIANECMVAANERDSNSGRVIANRMKGGALMLQGNFEQGKAHLAESVRLYDLHQEEFLAADELYALDHKVTALSYLALAQVATGEIQTAIDTICQNEVFAHLHTNLHSENYAITYRAAVHHLLYDISMTAEVATRSRNMAVEQGYASWEGMSRILLGHALFTKGDVEAGQLEFTLGRKVHEGGMEARLYLPFVISVAAKFLQRAGDIPTALETIDSALALTNATSELWYLPELLRLKGEYLFAMDNEPDALACLKQAQSLSDEQGAHLWNIRSAMSIARFASNETEKHQALGRIASHQENLPELKGSSDGAMVAELLAA